MCQDVNLHGYLEQASVHVTDNPVGLVMLSHFDFL